jgi:hypothetical protein
MPPFHKWTRPRGAVNDVATALALADSGCNILLLSDATLYVLQNLVALDVTFMSRWADQVFDNGYYPIREDSANYSAWVDLIHQIKGEVVDMSCEIVPVLEEIRDNIALSTGKLADIETKMQELIDEEADNDALIDDIEPILDAINVILGGAAILGG